MDSELLTKLLSISQTSFRHCRVRFYAFLDNLCRNSCILGFSHFRALVEASEESSWLFIIYNGSSALELKMTLKRKKRKFDSRRFTFDSQEQFRISCIFLVNQK